MRERERLAVRLRVRDALRLRVAVALRVAAADGGLYAHCNPAVTPRPPAPPTWTKYVRWVMVSASVEARRLEPHAAASSLPARHPNGSAHDGQPVPAYSTVLLAVSPHVDSRRVPPSGVLSLSLSAYTSREPG